MTLPTFFLFFFLFFNLLWFIRYTECQWLELNTRTSEVCFEIACVLQRTTRYKSNSEGNVNVSLLSVDYFSFLIMAF